MVLGVPNLVATVLVFDPQGGEDGQTELEGGKQQLSVAGHGTGQEVLPLLISLPTGKHRLIVKHTDTCTLIQIPTGKHR